MMLTTLPIELILFPLLMSHRKIIIVEEEEAM
jgi:hypothetical protein